MSRVLTTGVVAIALTAATVLGGAGVAVASHQFSDVPSDHPFHGDIDWLAKRGITAGYDDGTFRPTASVTRQAMARFLKKSTETSTSFAQTFYLYDSYFNIQYLYFTKQRGFTSVRRTAAGEFTLVANRDITACVATGSSAYPGYTVAASIQSVDNGSGGRQYEVRLSIRNQDSAAADVGVSVTVAC